MISSLAKTIVFGFCLLVFAKSGFAQAYSQPAFHASDPLAPRDEWGFKHQMAATIPIDFEPRFKWRPLYWLLDGHEVVRQPAYVAAVQRDLQLLGYYCGPIDGNFSAEVGDAIARLQKNYSMRVTGTVTMPVRRALHLP